MKTSIPFVSNLSRFRNIENRNKAFNNLTAVEKRREIAYDALMLVKRGLVKASYGVYWSWGVNTIVNECRTPKDLQTNFVEAFDKKRHVGDCTVCERGLFMISKIRLSNNIDPRDDNRDSGSKENLKGSGFEIKVFRQMEEEFEENNFDHPYIINSNEKLMNICCNVIANGNFKTTDKTDYLTKWNIKIDEKANKQKREKSSV